VGNDKEISIIELAKCYQALAKKEFNYSPKIIFKKNSDINYLIDSPNRRRPNLNLIKKKISYKPKISFETGVLKYLKYLKNEI
jgi:nucleoside-diphosphate-sugar epimerase